MEIGFPGSVSEKGLHTFLIPCQDRRRPRPYGRGLLRMFGEAVLVKLYPFITTPMIWQVRFFNFPFFCTHAGAAFDGEFYGLNFTARSYKISEQDGPVFVGFSK
jgi:hypothetical protein